MKRLSKQFHLIILLLISLSVISNSSAQTADDTWRTYASIDGQFVIQYPPGYAAAQRGDGLVILAWADVMMEIYPPSLIGTDFETPEALLNTLIEQVPQNVSEQSILTINAGDLPAATIPYTADDASGYYLTVAVAEQNIAIVDFHTVDSDRQMTQDDLSAMLSVVETFALIERDDNTSGIIIPESTAEALIPGEIDVFADEGSGGVIDAVLITDDANLTGELTETFTSTNGTLTFQHPEGWAVNETVDGSVIVTSENLFTASMIIFPVSTNYDSVLQGVLSLPPDASETMQTDIPVLFDLTEARPSAIYKFIGDTNGARIAVQVTPTVILTAEMIAEDGIIIAPESVLFNILASVEVDEGALE